MKLRFAHTADLTDTGADIGTTANGGANAPNGVGLGTVFEIAKTATGYASTPTTLVSFNGANGSFPQGSLIADAHGNLFGTTANGGANGDGTVYEIAKTAHGYSSTPTTLVNFNGANGQFPAGGLIADAHGNLFGTTAGFDVHHVNGDGTVFEIAKTAHGYASTPITLVSFNGTNGQFPAGGLIADAHGDLFGTTAGGGAYFSGTVFEIAKTATGYASTPTTLVSFNDTNGRGPIAGLIADADGDPFGTTVEGGVGHPPNRAPIQPGDYHDGPRLQRFYKTPKFGSVTAGPADLLAIDFRIAGLSSSSS